MLFRILLVFLVATSAAVAAPALDAPASAQVGSEITFTVSGVGNPRDFVTVVPKAARDGAFETYVYVQGGGKLKLLMPPEPGDYELRLLGANTPYPTIVKRALRLEASSVTLDAPASVAAGAKLNVTWKGPNNARDYIGIGSAKQPYVSYVYTSKGSPLELTAPDEPGPYEIRYFLASGNKIIASRAITVGGVTASIEGPAQVVAGTRFDVKWTGPDNARDFINLVPKGAHEGSSGAWAYTAKGNPAKVLAPLEAGEYELRYSTGQSQATLARTSIRITPAKEEPGLVAVTMSGAVAMGNAVEIILDASGSMLQRLGNERRIDVARQTLTRLTSSVIPAGTPFALRVFGREVDSCQTDLFVPLGPLDAQIVGAQIGKLEAKNGAKTPIAASLAKVASDLGSVGGERLVILLTDGEETCNGDPAAEIEKLQSAGDGVRVNIVGFALDDAKLAQTFERWAAAGNGAFFEAKDAAALSGAMTQALQPAFEIVNAKGDVVAADIAGATPVKVMPGTYTVRLKGRQSAPQTVTVRPKETSTVRF